MMSERTQPYIVNICEVKCIGRKCRRAHCIMFRVMYRVSRSFLSFSFSLTKQNVYLIVIDKGSSAGPGYGASLLVTHYLPCFKAILSSSKIHTVSFTGGAWMCKSLSNSSNFFAKSVAILRCNKIFYKFSLLINTGHEKTSFIKNHFLFTSK